MYIDSLKKDYPKYNIYSSNINKPVSYTHLDVYKRQVCDNPAYCAT